MRITIAGTGYVGLVTGACLANTGNEVTCLDVDEGKVRRLSQGACPIYEPGLEELLRRNLKAGRLRFTSDRRAGYAGAEVIFICVGTPPDSHGRPDTSAVMAVAADIAAALEGGATGDDVEPIVVVKSTVPVGTSARVRAAIRQKTRKPFTIASNPEFLKEGGAVADFLKPDRVVIGVQDKRTGHRLRELYEPFVRQGNPIFIMDTASAEMVKYAANAMLAMRISFINEVAGLCEALGADVDEVRRGMCADRRIGSQFLYPGLGYGGSCFPKDVQACIEMGRQVGRELLMMSAVHEVNQRQRRDFLAKVEGHFQRLERREEGGAAGGKPSPLAGRKIAVWGMAFKPQTDDVRQSPALELMRDLAERGAQVIGYDPAAGAKARAELPKTVQIAQDMWAAVQGADALVVATNWDEFMHPDFGELKQRMRQAVVFDGRNLYHPATLAEHGFTYYSVGRNPVLDKVSLATAGRK